MNALILKGAAPIIARAMADEMDVVVKFHDGPPCTAKKVIYLPQLPINDPNAAAMTRFHIGHEAGHIAHTDEDCPSFIANRNERLHRLWNCLEDIFMESCQIRKFPGYKSFISQGMKAMEGKLLTPQEGDSWSVVEVYLLTIGYRDGLGIKSVNDYFAVCEKAGVDLLPAGLLNALHAAAIGARSLNDTAEVFQLAERLLSIIDNPPPEPPPPPESKQDSDSSQETGEEADDDTDAERQPSTGEGSDSSPAPSDIAAPSSGGTSQGGPTASQQAALDQLKDEPTEPYKGFGEMLRDAIEDVSDDVPVESRLDPDYMNYKVAKPYKDQSAIAKVMTVSNKARLRCREQMLSVRRAERTYHASGSRLSARKVTNIMRGDYRVFERISEGVNTNCAVQILLDASGSMNTYGAMEVARDTALALAAALQAIDGVDVSIASFPSNLVGLPFGAKAAEYAGNISSQKANGGTPLAEALMAMAPALLSQLNPRKVCFVITDGEPNSVPASLEAIEHLEMFGVEMIGVGILHDITSVIPRSRRVDKLEDLPKAVFEAITDQARNRR